MGHLSPKGWGIDNRGPAVSEVLCLIFPLKFKNIVVQTFHAEFGNNFNELI